MTITLTVPEAAATPDTIQFKLVLEGDVKYPDLSTSLTQKLKLFFII
jgi:hypothetical protein